MALTTSAAASAGARIVVVAANRNNLTVPSSARDGAGNAYTRHALISNGSERLAIFSAHAAGGLAAGSPITVTWSGNSAYTRVMAASFTGVAATGAVDQVNTVALSGGGATWTTGSVTTTVAETLLFGAAGISADRTSTPDADWTELHDVHRAAASEGTTTVYRTVSSTGTYSASGTWTGGGIRTGAIVAFKAATAGGAASLAENSVFSAVRSMQLGALRTSGKTSKQAYFRR
jgi:hypothetical protein